jgi:hypothetical protein
MLGDANVKGWACTLDQIQGRGGQLHNKQRTLRDISKFWVHKVYLGMA